MMVSSLVCTGPVGTIGGETMDLKQFPRHKVGRRTSKMLVPSALNFQLISSRREWPNAKRFTCTVAEAN